MAVQAVWLFVLIVRKSVANQECFLSSELSICQPQLKSTSLNFVMDHSKGHSIRSFRRLIWVHLLVTRTRCTCFIWSFVLLMRVWSFCVSQIESRKVPNATCRQVTGKELSFDCFSSPIWTSAPSGSSTWLWFSFIDCQSDTIYLDYYNTFC